MKYFVIFIVVLCSCKIRPSNNNIAQTANQDSLVIELLQNDFLIYTDSSKIDSVKQVFTKDFNIFCPEINRFVHVDAEELTEGSFDFFKTDLIEILSKRGLEITFSTTENFEKLHEVMINNNRFSLFDDKDLADYSFWDIGSRRFFEKLNQELEKSKSHERFYLLYKANDLGAILLTDKQFELIEKINEGNIKEIPYRP